MLHHQHLTDISYEDLTDSADRPNEAVQRTVARLRAFAVLLCLDAGFAEKLLAFTLLQLSVSMKLSSIGPNLEPSLFSRLRCYYHQYGQKLQAEAASVPAPGPHNATSLELLDILAQLPVEQREALIIVDAAGRSVAEAERICCCPPVRFKKRLAKARAAFAKHGSEDVRHLLQGNVLPFVFRKRLAALS